MLEVMIVSFMPLVWMPQRYRDELLVPTATDPSFLTSDHYRMYDPDAIVSSTRGYWPTKGV